MLVAGHGVHVHLGLGHVGRHRCGEGLLGLVVGGVPTSGELGFDLVLGDGHVRVGRDDAFAIAVEDDLRLCQCGGRVHESSVRVVQSVQSVQSVRSMRSMRSVRSAPSGAEDRAAAAGGDQHVASAVDLVGGRASQLTHAFDDVVHAVDVALAKESAIGVHR